MNFMYSAGVRLCIREGLVKLPDQENVVMYDDIPRKRRGLELPGTVQKAQRYLYLRPGETPVVKIGYGQTNPQREVVWAGRGKRWVTEILFGVWSWATSVRLVNVSDRNVWIDTRTALAWIVEYGHIPKEPGFVHPGKIRYKEWQRLILESTESRQGRMRAERLERLVRLRDPPVVPRPEYQ
ncbi:Aspartic protease [Phytophthora megakarya]|uniref:Aspartic protease n=1 Tax=Phytophthora megakarya TaxID=4795 RepID=A0A225VN27_9STRA|nr:Aspartic protease [Phytophthora megakarya]